MNKHTKLITALLTLIFSLSAFTLFSASVSAEGNIDGGGQGGDTPVIVDPEPVYTDPITPEPVYTDPVVVYTDPVVVYTDPPYDPGNGGNSDNGNTNTNNYSDGNNSNSSDNSSSVYYDSDGNEYSDQSEVYVGGGQSYEPPVSTAPSAPLIKTEKDIDVNELSKNDWNDIKASLTKAQKGGADSGDDFSFIQKNTSKADNGHMFLVIGIAMVILSVAGFTYLIVSAVRRKNAAPIKGVKSAGGSAPSRYRDESDYDDGYKKQVSSKKASKFNTAKIPKAKSKGGTRYR
ncbi:MAG: hypothetical protein UH734_00870 [Ruminococcus sp.]|nr:hypothetical protein [Ruminococcus sp.]